MCDEVFSGLINHTWLRLPIISLKNTQDCGYGCGVGVDGCDTLVLDFADPDFYNQLKEIGK